MPTYEFRCPDGHTFERFYRKISDAASELPCPECGKPAVRQLSGGAGLVFKGSGFYLTDYGKNAHRKPGPDSSAAGKGATGESGGGTSESKSSSGSAEAKPSETKSGSSTDPKGATGAGGSGGSASSPAKSSGGSNPKSDK